MLCRLCLNETANGLINIFDEAGELVAEQIQKSIKIFLDIELLQNDEISTKICQICWNRLDDFNSFCKDVAEKQQQLKEQLAAKSVSVAAERGVSVIKRVAEEAEKFDANLEHVSLCEPQIDLSDMSLSENAVVGIKEDSDSSSLSSLASSSSSSIWKKRNTTLFKAKTSTNPLSHEQLPKRKRSLLEIGLELDAYIAEHIELACCLCQQSLENFAELKIHFHQVHNCAGYMLCCNNRYKKRSRLVEHLKVHNDPNYYKCSICAKVLINRNSFKSHMYRMHPSEDQLNYNCTICSEKFTKQYLLDIHTNKQHGKQQALECEICRKIYRSAGSLRDHMTYVHSNVNNKICDYCGQVLRSKQGLAYHMRAKHQIGQQKELQCKLCGKWLKNERSLYKHNYNHQQEASNKKFTCPKCGIEKSTRTKLACHIRYHHNHKNYKCSDCSKEFKSKVSLEEHLATHSGKDLYSCPFCSRTFKSHANRHNHKKKAHPDKWVPRNTRPTQKETTEESLVAA